MSDTIEQALSNLDKIKNDEEIEQGSNHSGTAVNTDSAATGTATKSFEGTGSEALDAAIEVVNEAFKECGFLSYLLDRSEVTVAVADWPSRRGLCKYNQKATEQFFGERVPSSKINSCTGHYTIFMAKGIYENNMKWKDTLLHELAHCAAHRNYDQYPKRNGSGKFSAHGSVWKNAAVEIGAEPRSCAPRDNEDRKPYRFACTNGCWVSSKTRRSKKIQRPWTRVCNQCGDKCTSYDAGDERPEEPVCAVESIKWDDVQSYNRSDKEL
jgi:predicted SprT family Zn-dependent metalloprotease